jgi:hypothetical protein
MSIEQILKERDNKAKAKRKKQKELKKLANKKKKRNFINITCIKCNRDYHILVNNKENWKDVDLKKYICPLCRPIEKLRRI